MSQRFLLVAVSFALPLTVPMPIVAQELALRRFAGVWQAHQSTSSGECGKLTVNGVTRVEHQCKGTDTTYSLKLAPSAQGLIGLFEKTTKDEYTNLPPITEHIRLDMTFVATDDSIRAVTLSGTRDANELDVIHDTAHPSSGVLQPLPNDRKPSFEATLKDEGHLAFTAFLSFRDEANKGTDRLTKSAVLELQTHDLPQLAALPAETRSTGSRPHQ